jgi:hypothetical protein
MFLLLHKKPSRYRDRGVSGEGGSRWACGSAVIVMKRPGEYKVGKNPTNQTYLILPLPLRNQVFLCRINELQTRPVVKSEDEL